MMTKPISLPSDSQVMSNQAFAVIAATQTALAMIEAGAARIGTSSSVKIIGKP